MDSKLSIINSDIEELTFLNIARKRVSIKISLHNRAVIEIVYLDVSYVVLDGVNNADT